MRGRESMNACGHLYNYGHWALSNIIDSFEQEISEHPDTCSHANIFAEQQAGTSSYIYWLGTPFIGIIE